VLDSIATSNNNIDFDIEQAAVQQKSKYATTKIKIANAGRWRDITHRHERNENIQQ
jgi:hypothetical protein